MKTIPRPMPALCLGAAALLLACVPGGVGGAPADATVVYSLTPEGVKRAQDGVPASRDPLRWPPLLVASGDDAVLVVLRDERHTVSAWRVGAQAQTPVQVDLALRNAESVLCGVPVGSDVLLGTTCGLISVRGDSATRLDRFADLGNYSYMLPDTQLFQGVVPRMAIDGALNVWLRYDSTYGRGGHDWFSADERGWIGGFQDQPAERKFPRMRRWTAPCEAICGDPGRGGLWTYGTPPGEAPGVFRVDPANRKASVLEAERTAIAVGQVAHIDSPVLAADARGRLWLGGSSSGLPALYCINGGEVTKLPLPPAILPACVFTGLASEARGTLYAATSCAGVLVFDGKDWRSHPVNDHLAVVENTDLKPAEPLALDMEGNLWVANGCNLVCWQAK